MADCDEYNLGNDVTCAERNAVPGRTIVGSTDAAALKDFALTESFRLQFRIASFNIR
jgi:hypothetical protein